MVFLKLAYMLVLIIIGIPFISPIRRNNRSLNMVGVYSAFSSSMLFHYCVIPVIYYMNEEAMLSISELNYFIESTDFDVFFFSCLLVLISFTVLTISYNSVKMVLLRRSKSKNEFSIVNFSVNKVFSIMGYLTFFVGGISFLILLSALGGISRMFYYSERVRSFSTTLADFVPYRISLLFIPARLITVTPVMFFYLFFNRKRKIHDAFFLIVSIILSTLFLLFNAGRGPLLAFFFPFFFLVLDRLFTRPWTASIVLGFFALPLLDILDYVFFYFSYGYVPQKGIDFLRYVNQFIHPFRNLLNVIPITRTYGFRLGSDFITAPISLIPGISFEPSYVNTSIFFAGSRWRITGGIPNDIITFGYLQCGILGIVFLFIVLGALFALLDNSLSKLHQGIEKRFIVAVLVINSFLFVGSADLVALIRSNFLLTVTAITIMVVSRYLPYSNKEKF